MSPIVRGNRLIVVQEPPSKVAQAKPSTIPFGGSTRPQMGDKLTVGGRKKGGWLRVKNQRTGLVTTLRVGPWIAKVPHFEDGYEMPSPMDQLIRAAQVERLEDALDKKDKEIERLKMLLQDEQQPSWLEVEGGGALLDARTTIFAKDQQIKALMHQRDEEALANHNALNQAELRSSEQEKLLADYKRELRDAAKEAQKREDTLTAQLKRALGEVHDMEQHVAEWEVWRRDIEAVVKTAADASLEREKELQKLVEDYQQKLSGWIDRATKSEACVEQLRKELKDCQEQLSNATWERDDMVEREWNLRNTSRSTTWGQGN